jgi:hypothetical protein
MSGVDLSSSFLALKISYFRVKTQASFPASQCQQTTEFQFAFEKKRNSKSEKVTSFIPTRKKVSLKV